MVAVAVLWAVGLWQHQHPGPAAPVVATAPGASSKPTPGMPVTPGTATTTTPAAKPTPATTSAAKPTPATTTPAAKKAKTAPVARRAPSPPAPPSRPARLAASVPAGTPTTSLVATARAALTVYATPGGARVSTLSYRTDLGTERVLLVAATRGAWTHVYLPGRPNGSTGWVHTAAVVLNTDAYAIVVNRGAHTLTLTRARRAIAVYPVAVGKASTPTPAGHFYVTTTNLTGNPAGAYGPAALGLSGHSNVLTTFGSGDGIIGIHGTNEAASVGRSVSHGCVRMRNVDVLKLIHITPAGTPVIII